MSHCREQPIKNGTKKLTNLNEVDEMIVFIIGADGDEEFFKWNLVSFGQSPVRHIKSWFLEFLPEMISSGWVAPLDGMSACLNMNICCPGGYNLRVILDDVHLGHSECVLLWVGIEPTGESDIIHCGFGWLIDLLYEGIDWSVDICSLETWVIISIWNVNSLHHLPSLLGDEGEIRWPTFLRVVVDCDDVHIRFIQVDYI